MNISRREFLRIMGGSAAALAFPGVIIQGCKKALDKASARMPVIWIQAQSCSGCSVSLMNKKNPDIAGLITEYISLNYHQTLMTATGHVAVSILEEAVEKKRKDFMLVVEGSIPVKSGKFCTLGEIKGKHVSAEYWIRELGSQASLIAAVGSCSAFGGIPGAIPATGEPNPTGAKPLSEILKDKKIINIPGCPPHPDWIAGTIMHILLKQAPPELDEYSRPLMYYAKTVHDACEHLKDYKKGKFARDWGEPGCLYQLGCLGIDTGCDIPTRKWLEGANSCTGSGAGCIGCTESVFPDFGRRGLYKHRTAWCEPAGHFSTDNNATCGTGEDIHHG